MQQIETSWDWVRRHWLSEALAVMGIVGVVALVRWDQVIDVSYRRVPVISVQQTPGHDLADRAVIVDLGTRKRLVRTSDWLIQAHAGGQVCIAENRMLLRRFTYVKLVLPGYCGPPPAGATGISAG